MLYNVGEVIKLAIKKDYLIEKRNVLNELRSNNMKLQELRFFSIYLAKINARDISTRVVRFPMSDYQKIMDMDRLNMSQLKDTTDALLGKVVKVPYETGYKAFQIFKQCTVAQDENSEWYVEIDAHDEALPLMFDFKDRYFTYELWNALSLKSVNQLRMYELLKQYEHIGERTIGLDDLKELLGMDKSDYPRYNSFRPDVLEVCREALETYTNIKFTYEPIRKKGKGGKINAIKFTISRNNNYIDQLSLSDFIDIQTPKSNRPEDTLQVEFKNERLSFLADACNNEFSESEIQVLYNLIIQIIPNSIGGSSQDYQIKAYDYLKHRYDELTWRTERKEIKNRFGYIKKMLEAAID
jgi:plasmid replication initiation protein